MPLNALALTIILCLISFNSYADQVEKQQVTKDTTIKVPFNGFLLSNEALSKIISTSETEIKLLKLEIEKLKKEKELLSDNEKQICKLKLDTSTSKYNELLSVKDIQKSIYEEAIRNSKPKWYENPYFNFISGTIVGLGSSTLLYYVVSNTK